jgi:hypothetical protein
VGGTGFADGNWVVPNGFLTKQSIAAVKQLAQDLPVALGGSYNFHTMLWHQGEADAGDNQAGYHSTYCNHLIKNLSPLIDHLRANFPGASSGTPFIDGGMLPYWVDSVNGSEGVQEAIYAINTSRPCTATADTDVFPEFFPGTHTPYGDPNEKSGVSGEVIHLDATEEVRMGYQYWDAYRRAIRLESVVPSAKTSACTHSMLRGKMTTQCSTLLQN